MLRRLALAFRCGGWRIGPLVVILVALTALGLGAHAALDWHRHGKAGAEFFHLHVHFGHHHHGGFDHHHREAPQPDAPPDDRRDYGTLTLALGVGPPPAVATAERPIREIDDRVPMGAGPLTHHQPIDSSWNPRGPPV